MSICIYAQNETNFANNGLGILTPYECTVSEEAAGRFELKIIHPIDETLRWALLANGAIIKAPVPVRESPLYEIEQEVPAGETASVARRTYRINTPRMYLREEPKSNTRKLCSLQMHSEVVLLEHESGNKWAKVAVVRGGQVGFCPFGGLTFVRQTTELVAENKIVGARAIEIRQSREQLFRINNVETDTQRQIVSATALHISYDSRGNIVAEDYIVEEPTALDTVLNGIESKLASPSMLKIHADKLSGDVTGDFGFKSQIEALFDPDEGIVKQLGAVVIRDNSDMYLLPDVPRDMGVTVRRGKNLVGVVVNADASNVVTRIIPVGKDKDGDPLYLNEKTLDSPLIGDYPVIYSARFDTGVQTVKKDADNKTKFSTDAATRNKMRELAEAEFSEKGVDLPSYGMEVNFIQLENTEDYAAYASLQAVHLFDTVSVIDELIGLKAKLSVTGYDWDCLTQQYISVKLGRMEEVQPQIYSFQLPDGGISGNKLMAGSVPGSVMRNATLDYAKIGTAAIERLAADAITAVTARIQSLAAGTIETDELYAGIAEIIAAKIGTLTASSIETDSLAAALARFVVLAAGTASFDRATIAHLVAGAMNLSYGVGEDVFISNLRVAYAQVVSATIGNLCIKASDGGYYNIDVDADGNVSATPATVTNGEIAAGQTSAGRAILETDITAANLSTSNLLATYALVNRIDAARIDVDELFARRAFITQLVTSKIFGGKSLTSIAGAAENAARMFRQETAPTPEDGAKVGDMWVVPSTGANYQAAASMEISFALNENGVLGYELTGDYAGEGLLLDGDVLFADGFLLGIDEQNKPLAAFCWTSIDELHKSDAPPASARIGQLWLDTSVSPVLLRRCVALYESGDDAAIDDCWQVVNDTETLQYAQGVVESDLSRHEEHLRTLGMMVVQDEEGVHVRRPVTNPSCETLITDNSFNVKTNGRIASTFGASHMAMDGQTAMRTTTKYLIIGG